MNQKTYEMSSRTPVAVIAIVSCLLCAAGIQSSHCTNTCSTRNATSSDSSSIRQAAENTTLDISRLNKEQLQSLLDNFANNPARLGIRTLTCRHNRCVNAEVLHRIVITFPSIETLSLVNCGALSHDDFGIIAKLTNLKRLKLDFWNTRVISSNALAAIANEIRGLEELALGNYFFCGRRDNIAAIKAFTNLKKLSLSGPVDEESFAAIAHLPELKELAFSWMLVTRTGLQLIADHARKLESLCLFACSSLGDNLDVIAQFTHLKKLYLSEMGVNRDALSAIVNGIKGLELIDLAYLDLKAEDFTLISSLPHLKAIYLHRAGIDDHSLASIIDTFKDLEELGISDCHHVSPEGLKTVAQLANLRKFYAAGSMIDDNWRVLK